MPTQRPARRAIKRPSNARARKPNATPANDPITPPLLRKIKGLVSRNAHTEAVVVLAKALGDKRDVKVLEAIQTVSEYAGETPYALISIRLGILRALIDRARRVSTPEAAETLYRLF